MSTNIIPFPVERVKARPDPAFTFFARYVDLERQINDPGTPGERRTRLQSMLAEIDTVMAREVRP